MHSSTVWYFASDALMVSRIWLDAKSKMKVTTKVVITFIVISNRLFMVSPLGCLVVFTQHSSLVVLPRQQQNAK